jgi:hypothetical protein
VGVGLVAALALWTLGCAAAEAPAAADGRAHIKRLAILYGRFVQEANGRAPRDEEEFRTFVVKRLAGGGVAVGDESGDPLISPRDGKRYVILCGSQANKTRANGLAAYEQEGAGGLRLAAFTMGIVEEVDESRLQDILNGKN